jgi:NAD-dependent SIR2 family protein deacetylase
MDDDIELAPTPNADTSALKALLQMGPFAVMTGAGLSTASGIPAYRDHEGRWQHTKPIQHQEFLQSETVRRRYWARSFVGWPVVSTALPNTGHHALAQLEHMGLITKLITQNVDGLHQKAGSSAVIELHGGIGQVRCLGCQQTFSRAEMQTWLKGINAHFDLAPPQSIRSAPDGDAHLEDASYASFQLVSCPRCQGMLKPDVVFFGDNVPRDRVAEAAKAIEDAGALLVVGSSLIVYSGFRFADLAYRTGKPVVAINQGVTRADAFLTAKLDADCSVALAQLLQLATPGR